MPDKKCPNCNLWNSEITEQCDCGYNFILSKMQYSVKKEEEYRKRFVENEISESKLRYYHNIMFIEIILCLSILFIVNYILRIQIVYCGLFNLIVSGIIIFFTLIIGNQYSKLIIRKLWIYPLIGIFLAWLIVPFIENNILRSLSSEPNNINYYILSALYHQLFSYFAMYVFSLIGLYIGKKRILNAEVKDYLEHKYIFAQQVASGDMAKAQ